MNEAKTHVNRDDQSTTVENFDAERAPRAVPDDHLATTRLPPLPRAAPINAGSHASPQPLAPAPQPPKGNWWRALIASTLPPPDRFPAAVDPRFVDRALALLCGATGLFLVLVAMIIGLREAPAQSLVPAGVAAVVVIARALFALAVLAFAAMLLRMAERFLAAGRQRD